MSRASLIALFVLCSFSNSALAATISFGQAAISIPVGQTINVPIVLDVDESAPVPTPPLLGFAFFPESTDDLIATPGLFSRGADYGTISGADPPFVINGEPIIPTGVSGDTTLGTLAITAVDLGTTVISLNDGSVGGATFGEQTVNVILNSLTVNVVPEPATFGSALIAIVAGLVRRRR